MHTTDALHSCPRLTLTAEHAWHAETKTLTTKARRSTKHTKRPSVRPTAGSASRPADENERRNANARFAFRLCCVGRLRRPGPLRGPSHAAPPRSLRSDRRLLRVFVHFVFFVVSLCS